VSFPETEFRAGPDCAQPAHNMAAATNEKTDVKRLGW